MSAGPHARHPVQIRHARPVRYVAAASLDEAVALLADPALAPARVVAGGTDLLLEIERGGRPGVATLIDISRAADAAVITVTDGVAHLGAMTTHADVVRHDALVRGALPLAQACWEVGSPQLRNRGTVAGNVVTASPANDTLSPLLALGASVTLRSARGSRTLAVADFVTGFRTTELAADELVAEVSVPLLGPSERGVFCKLGNRSAQAISVVHAAVVVDLGDDGVTVRRARIALGSVAPTVVIVAEAADALVGRPLDATTIGAAATAAAGAVEPIDDVRASAAYRKDVVAVVVARALRTIAAGREGERWPASAPVLSQRRPIPAPPRPGTLLAGADEIDATVDGRPVRAAGAAGATLLDWLRDAVGAKGAKEGCAEGECGACTVRLDGAAVMSCLVPAARADGAEIVTVEGLAAGGFLHPVQEAFVAASAVQCGFCTPGFLVAGAALLEECPAPTTEQIRQGFAGNLCRCTGYTAIEAAIATASGVRR
ncbi:MAG: FAD binding domain-containing protein [Acidimicrobiia bacterium]|nr:FAD binding domain-containing protein [Acidimicrobiia bacterium]